MSSENGTNGDDGMESQKDARAHVLAIPLFPELERRLVSILGPTAETIMLHQLIYWFSILPNRWSLYKTAEEWRAERGLSRKQVDRARKRLIPTRLVEEKKGLYKRVHYCIDWVRLCDVLEGGRLYPLKEGQSKSIPPKGDSVQSVPPRGESNMSVPPLGEADYSVPPSRGYKDEELPHENGENGLPGGPDGGDEPIQEITQESTSGEAAVDYFQKTPPPSSSSPGGQRDKEVENSLEKTDDDEKDKNPKNLNQGRDNDIRTADSLGTRVRATKKGWQQFADEIETISSEEISGEAKELAAYVTEKISRIEYGRAVRLAQRCISEARVMPLGSATGVCEEPCKSEVRNPYAYLLTSLAPPLGDEDPGAAVGDRFWAAYEEAQPLPTLNGSARKHKQYGIQRKPTRSTADYRKGDDIEAARKKRREEYPSDTEKYLEEF